jgi:hypothetical protein
MPTTQLADLVQAQNSGYETGKGQAQPNAIGLFIRTMLATKQKNLEMQQEYGLKKELIGEEQRAKSEAEKSTIQEIIGKGGSNQGGFQPTKFQYGGVTFENPEASIEQKKQEKLAEGIPTSEAGKFTLAEESIKNIQDVKRMLFPDGTPESFKRTTAFASNLPGGSLPMFASRGWGKAEQEVFRKMGAALSGRQLIQTGVAARPEETQKLISQFAASGGSNPESAFNGLTELEDFYKSYMGNVKGKGLTTKESTTTKQYIRTGTDSETGKRVGMLEDGTIEEIQ